MVERVRDWCESDIEVRIFTARAWRAESSTIKAIQDWSEKHIGYRLKVTCEKDYGMTELWDDRAVSVVPNMGVPNTLTMAGMPEDHPYPLTDEAIEKAARALAEAVHQSYWGEYSDRQKDVWLARIKLLISGR
jgi:hypothetical protein